MNKPVLQIDALGRDRWRCMIGGNPVTFSGSRERAVQFFAYPAERVNGRGLVYSDELSSRPK